MFKKNIPFPWITSETHWPRTDMFANMVTTYMKKKQSLETSYFTILRLTVCLSMPPVEQ